MYLAHELDADAGIFFIVLDQQLNGFFLLIVRCVHSTGRKPPVLARPTSANAMQTVLAMTLPVNLLQACIAILSKFFFALTTSMFSIRGVFWLDEKQGESKIQRQA